MGSTIIRTIDPDALNELANRRGWVKTKYTGLTTQQKKYAAFISQQYVATPAGIMSFTKFRQIWNNNPHKRHIAFGDTLYSWLREHEINSKFWWRRFGDKYVIIAYEWVSDLRHYKMAIGMSVDESSEKIALNHLNDIFIKNDISSIIDNVADAFKTIKTLDSLFNKGKPNIVIRRHVYTLPTAYFV